jgi:uncharacterized delta-60 repeat protein
MNRSLIPLPLIAAFILVSGLAGCGGGDDAQPAPPPVVVPPPPGTPIGAAGGTVSGPAGVSVVIPATALATEVRIQIEQTSTGAPALPAGVTASGQMFALTPHGTSFASPITVTLPFNPALVPAGAVPAVYKTTNNQTQWEEIPGAVFGATSVSAPISGFSFVTIGTRPGAVARQVERQWTMHILRGAGLTSELVEEDTVVGGTLSEVRDFGAAAFDSPLTLIDGTTRDADNIANGAIGSSEDGERLFVAAEAPFGNANLPESPVGSSVFLHQVQSFVKRSDTASLTVTIPQVFMEVHDRNAALHRLCPASYQDGLRCRVISARLDFSLLVFNTASPEIELIDSLNGSAQVDGFAENWHSYAVTGGPSRVPFWTVEDFDFDITSEALNGASESKVVMTLARPHTFPIDISSIEVGRVFHVMMDVGAFAYNVIAGPPSEFTTASAAYFMQAPGVGGPTLTSTGLEPAATPAGLVLPTSVPTAPRACTPGPGPNANAGVIQFALAEYSVGESTGESIVEITRTGGTVGAVSATFRTSDGTAIAGTDYSAVATTVFFADGDDEPRYVAVPPIEDDAGGEAGKTVNLTLSQPGGCAALGSRTSAVLTIRDDDPIPPPPSFTIGGTITGLAGSGLMIQDQVLVPQAFGNGPFTMRFPVQMGSAYAVTVTAQPVNPVQFCTVVNGSGTMGNANVTNIEINCVTPAASGALDPSFGGTGKVSTAFGGDDTGMVLQSDGKIIMVGGTAGTGSDFALARYDTDGTLDETFGAAGTGLVTTDLSGTADDARAVALQSDGKIIVVGSSRVGTNDDFAIVRYLANGTLDTTFATAGKVTTDFGGFRDRALAVTILPDNRILVVGDAIMPSPGNTDFGIARYTPNGAPDTTFDGDGKLNVDIGGGVDIAQNVLLQGTSGAFLVSGVLTLPGSPVLEHAGIARFSDSGALDSGFGTAGRRTFTGQAVGEALALQADGHILLAGHTLVAGLRHFALMRLDANGGTDGGFGTQGLATAGFTSNGDFGRAVAVHPDGRIFVAGQSSNASNPDFGVACFTSGGTLSGGFDTDGKLTVDFFASFDGAENIAIQADGKILVSGFAVNAGRTSYGLARIQP